MHEEKILFANPDVLGNAILDRTHSMHGAAMRIARGQIRKGKLESLHSPGPTMRKKQKNKEIEKKKKQNKKEKGKGISIGVV
jgi:hypothetical protein